MKHFEVVLSSGGRLHIIWRHLICNTYTSSGSQGTTQGYTFYHSFISYTTFVLPNCYTSSGKLHLIFAKLHPHLEVATSSAKLHPTSSAKVHPHLEGHTLSPQGDTSSAATPQLEDDTSSATTPQLKDDTPHLQGDISSAWRHPSCGRLHLIEGSGATLIWKASLNSKATPHLLLHLIWEATPSPSTTPSFESRHHLLSCTSSGRRLLSGNRYTPPLSAKLHLKSFGPHLKATSHLLSYTSSEGDISSTQLHLIWKTTPTSDKLHLISKTHLPRAVRKCSSPPMEKKSGTDKCVLLRQ
ncbi:hypothetical protein CEXT_210001 [Caerostris extrusa]|uniref:Uncharacterized protein n=1 Tax=Caerostris extrusa TaxID=172846 RepID=A0AAV4RZD1_CAEEX|nr:hypothetical protein CEXT_210001 [Caerostris extrusa]